MATLGSLLVPGVLGAYTHFEATEIFATRDGHPEVLNVFTLLVAEQLDKAPSPETSPYLNPDRITLKSLPGWTFGIRRYLGPIADLAPAATGMAETGVLSASGKGLQVGKLWEISPQFVPPDFTVPVPWNKVLKNNFWNGSHVFEWSDPEKKALQPFFEESRRLQDLSERIAAFVPVSLAALSDRLGNVAVQIPVTAALIAFGKLRASGHFTVNVAWHPAVPPRPLRASCELEFDGVVTGHASAAIEGPETVLPVPPGRGLYKGIVWDEANGAVMAVSGGAFINSIAFSMNIVNSEPRIFSIPRPDGSKKHCRVGVAEWRPTIIGDRTADDTGGYTHERMYEDQLQRLIAERVFLQYKPGPGESGASRDKALADLRSLIGRYGQEGAWLWDPYLSARDILETLFFCPHAKSDLRALTAAREPPCEAASSDSGQGSTGKKDFVENQRAVLNACESNWRGLRLEYRVRQGSHGFGFHDRFLIFPRKGESALAWSLGTSVNSLGTEHHILQKVDHGQLMRDAFIELWEELDQPGHLIWKKP